MVGSILGSLNHSLHKGLWRPKSGPENCGLLSELQGLMGLCYLLWLLQTQYQEAGSETGKPGLELGFQHHEQWLKLLCHSTRPSPLVFDKGVKNKHWKTIIFSDFISAPRSSLSPTIDHLHLFFWDSNSPSYCCKSELKCSKTFGFLMMSVEHQPF